MVMCSTITSNTVNYMITIPFGYSSWKEGVSLLVDSGLVRYKFKIV